ncbi:F-box/kelch-repeat protein At3g06240-like [Rhododendron vialii]|uniref:F-box/kelch-repeat protein At3g06240-like n=1 Tax=Rhododendron vialii TaxID=182163 RepID=UPI00265FE6B2|nr:F-box/kelch-repeat protein At3g06240-like [Rhododendron vialii]
MSKGETNDFSHWAIFPPEIIADILSRLPVKSLCRFKCVSPSWNFLISSPYFAQTHLNRTNASNPKHLVRNIIFFCRSHDLYSVNLTADIPFATKIDFSKSLQQPPENKWANVLGSCNGLLLASDKGNNSNFLLLNPSTRECKKLPPLPFVIDLYMYGYGLGYDSSKDDYKVVLLSSCHTESGSKSESQSESSTLSGTTIVAVYSHKTNAWRRIKVIHCILGLTSFGVNCNGRLHWLSFRGNSYVMVAFDWEDEIFREVPLPASFVHDDFAYYDVVIVGDCLCLVDKTRSVIWMMKEYGVRASWTKILICRHNMRLLDVLGLFAEEEFVLNITGKMIQDKLVVYNPTQRTLRGIPVRGIPTIFRFGGTYVESLVSPHLCNHGGGIGKQGQSSSGMLEK